MQRTLIVAALIFLVLVLIGSCDMHMTTARGKAAIQGGQENQPGGSP